MPAKISSLVCMFFLATVMESGFARVAFADALEGKLSPAEIIGQAGPDQWRDVDPAQILVMELERGRVTIELSDIFAQGHVNQVKTLVKSGFYDGLSFYRVIDGFVAQGGDPFNERALPEGAIEALPAEFETELSDDLGIYYVRRSDNDSDTLLSRDEKTRYGVSVIDEFDGYTSFASFYNGFPVGVTGIYLDLEVAGVSEPERTGKKGSNHFALLHCTGAFAFGRNTPRDSASTEFYITLQPQRYLDRNLTVFGKVIDGMEHLQALKRQLPPETKEDPLGETILRAWMGDQRPEGEAPPAWQVFRTDTQTFGAYVESRRNRPEDFFYHRPDHVDVCALQIPVREKPTVTADDSEE